MDLFLGPGLEAAPVVLGVPPDNLDQIQFRAVGRQMHQDQPMVDQPILQFLRINIMVHGGVFQHHQRERGHLGFMGWPLGDQDR